MTMRSVNTLHALAGHCIALLQPVSPLQAALTHLDAAIAQLSEHATQLHADNAALTAQLAGQPDGETA
ncbi:hypothetical protein [Xanthomonas hortorum]|uniref:hypothetical protein n=1 Tax=Xanthomonas hortorum TaxID=56454 RepID=UPI000CEF51B9|nr:hypothetical protein [Xanthomonas hortorum]MCE4371800.1 hypothetical protein [Xanthomonas hortorum pv. hederae]PPU80332.1 hypothetical protein XhhCFBP4925_11950 [Xanthomonas hortorum pv. hederae]PUE99721.1 hypothetical protein C7T87_12355 [Xanthomonas hortorum pv. hederae]